MVFLDELPPGSKEIVTDCIQFLRNLCRAVKIPVILSGTNARVTNLIAKSDAEQSRTGPSVPWVLVITKLPKANLQSFGNVIKFKDDHNVEHCLHEFLNENGTINYMLLKQKLYSHISNEDPSDIYIRELLELISKQVSTSLPGIVCMVMQKAFDLIASLREQPVLNVKTLWVNLNERILTETLRRKPKMKNSNGLISSAHINTFPSHIKNAHEIGSYSTKNVDNHLFFYGKRNDSLFVLELGLDLDLGAVEESSNTDREGSMRREESQENQLPQVNEESSYVLIRNNELYEHQCYFPELSEDLFSNLIAFNTWKKMVTTNPLKRFTLAYLYTSYLKSFSKHPVDSNAEVTDFFALELLAHWSVCHSSHLSFTGETEGTAFAMEFIKNLQDKLLFSGFGEMPSSLVNILNQLSVPYLLNPSSSLSLEFITRLSKFMKIGYSERPVNKVGVDVHFNINFQGQDRLGFVECKLWKSAVGYANFYKYYAKACEKVSESQPCCLYPISFMVASRLQNTISSENSATVLEEILKSIENSLSIEELEQFIKKLTIYFEEEEEEENEEEKEEKEKEKEEKELVDIQQKKAKKIKKTKKNYFTLLYNLWKDARNHINIYTVNFVVSQANTGKFVFRTLKAFDNPQGAFILVESNFQPELRSNHS